MATVQGWSTAGLILALSDALELASDELAQHQLRTAYIAMEMARAAGLPAEAERDLFTAAILHDVGALSPEEKLSVHRAEAADLGRHCAVGRRLLERVPALAPVAPVVGFHHTPWSEGREIVAPEVLGPAQFVLLADTVERSVDRDRYILLQVPDLVSSVETLSGSVLDPEAVAAFGEASARESFWLTLVSPRLHELVGRRLNRAGDEGEAGQLASVSGLFRNLIDFRSHFTSTHSAGVAASASALGAVLGMTPLEVELLEVAGNLHDIGKMAVPNAILEKPAGLTREEVAVVRQHTYHTFGVLSALDGGGALARWAAYHHETLDGTGYPFRIRAEGLDLGTRIMAVADILTALAEDRPYRQGLLRGEVMGELRRRSVLGALDPDVVQALEDNFEEVHEAVMRRQADARHEFRRDTGVN